MEGVPSKNSFCLEFFGTVGIGGERRMKCSKNKKLIKMSFAMHVGFFSFEVYWVSRIRG